MGISYTYIKRMGFFYGQCSYVWHLHNRFNLILFEFGVTDAFDSWLAMHVKRAADYEMCIHCLGVNKYFSFLFWLYFGHYSLYKCGIKGKIGTFPKR